MKASLYLLFFAAILGIIWFPGTWIPFAWSALVFMVALILSPVVEK